MISKQKERNRHQYDEEHLRLNVIACINQSVENQAICSKHHQKPIGKKVLLMVQVKAKN